MWGNITKSIGNVVDRVKTFQTDLEHQLDTAVGADDTFSLSQLSPVEAETEEGLPEPQSPSPGAPALQAPGYAAQTLSSSDTFRLEDVSLESPQPASQKKSKEKAAAPPPTSAHVPIPTPATTPTLLDRSTDPAGKEEGKLARVSAALKAAEADVKRLSESNAKTQKAAAAELQAKEKEVVKLSESKAQLTKVVEETQALLKKTEAELRVSNKNLSALQAVNQSFTDKLAALEGQLKAKVEELTSQSAQIANQKRSLDSYMAAANSGSARAELRASASNNPKKVAEQDSPLLEEVRAARQKIIDLEMELETERKTLSSHVARKSPEGGKAAAGGGPKGEGKQREEASILRKRVADLEKNLQDASTLREQVKGLETALDNARKSETKSKLDVALVEAKVQTLQKSLDDTAVCSISSESVASSQLKALQEQVAALQASLESTKQELVVQQAAYMGTEAAHSADLAKVQEVVKERERALESAALKMAETHQQLEEANKRISDLRSEMTEKDANIRELATSTIGESDAKRQVAQYLEQLKVQNERLASYEAEGQTLAKKQSEMEKLVRKTNQEMKGKDKEIAKLNESKAQLNKVIEEMQEALRKNESDVSSTHKSLSAMQAVSQASTDKLAKLEAEVATKADEISSQKRALESSWAEANELKRGIAEMRAERDDLKRQIGEGTSKVIETESSVRDIATREAVLRATNKQLQDGMQRQMQESSSREERLRDEVNEMRKRWQEAITSREALATEMGGATAPLLRQISALQDSLRVRGESWQAIESSLSERALRAESAAEVTEHKRSTMEEQLTACKHQLSITATRLQDAQQLLHSTETQVDRMRRAEASSIEATTELEARLSLESGQRQSLQASLRELEVRHKLEIAELEDERARQVGLLKVDTENLQRQLEAAIKDKGSGAASASRNVAAQMEQDANELSPIKPTITMAEVLPSKLTIFSFLHSIFFL